MQAHCRTLIGPFELASIPKAAAQARLGSPPRASDLLGWVNRRARFFHRHGPIASEAKRIKLARGRLRPSSGWKARAQVKRLRAVRWLPSCLPDS